MRQSLEADRRPARPVSPPQVLPDLRKQWREISLEKKLAMFVAPLFVAVASGVLVPVILRSSGDDDTGAKGAAVNDDVRDYRLEVQAACSSLQPTGNPVVNEDGTVDTGPYLALVGRQLNSWEAILTDLWKRPVPNALKDDAVVAQRSARTYFRRTREVIKRLRSELRDRVDFWSFLRVLQQRAGEGATATARFEVSMRRLAGEPCMSSAAGGNPSG